MQHQQQLEIERGGQAAQQTQNEILKDQLKLAHAIAKMMVKLARSFGNKKGENEETKIEIKVDGKTKLKSIVKNGQFIASKNELTADQVKSLKAYFASLPNPAIKPKDFDVMVDNKTVLSTKDGVIVSHATPTVTPEQAAEAKQAFATIQNSPKAEDWTQAPVAQSRVTLEPVQTNPSHSESPSPQPAPTPIPVAKTPVPVEPQRTVSPPPVVELARKAAATEGDRQVETVPFIRQVSEPGYSPPPLKAVENVLTMTSRRTLDFRKPKDCPWTKFLNSKGVMC